MCQLPIVDDIAALSGGTLDHLADLDLVCKTINLSVFDRESQIAKL